MGTGILFLALPLSLAVFGVLLRHALEMKKALNYREMWGTLFWACAPFGISCVIWAATSDSPVVVRNITLGLVGAAIGAAGLIWVGYVISGPTRQSNQGPALGSLTYSNFIANIHSFVRQNTVTAELVIELRNTNDFLVAFRAKIKGQVNDKELVPGGGQIEFDGYVYSQQPTSLIYRFGEVPTHPQVGTSTTVSGWLEYDVVYFVAPNGKQTRRTVKRISFETHAPLQTAPPPTGIGIVEHGEQVHVLFSNEIEE